MGQTFDPYHTWLGIPAEDQPPHHYRLLGLEPLEGDREVIINAVNQRLAHIKSKLATPQAAAARELVNKITSARVCLLSPDKKEEYDTALRHGLGRRTPAPAAAPIKRAQPLPTAQPLTAAKPVTKPKAKPPAGKSPTKLARPATKKPAPDEAGPAQPPSGTGPQIVTAGDPRVRPHRKPSWVTPVVVLALLVAFAAGAAGVAYYKGYLPVGSPEVIAQTDDDGAQPTVPRDDPPTGESHSNPETGDAESTPQDGTGAAQAGTPQGDPQPTDPATDVDPANGESEAPDPGKSGSLTDEPWAGLFEDSPDPDAAAPHDGDRPVKKPDPATVNPQPPGSQKWAVPSREAQDEAKVAIRRIFQDEIASARTPSARIELAQKLLSYADQTKKDPAARYTLITLARDLAAYAGESMLILQSVNLLAEEYEIDSLKMKADTYTLANRSASDAQVLSGVMESTRPLIDQAVRESRYEIAAELAEMCLASARRLRSADLVSQCSALRKEIHAKKMRYEFAARARETLITTPDDPEAHLALGKYLVLTKRDWKTGLPHLARGADDRLAETANLELADPAGPEAKMAIAELWLKLSLASRGEEGEPVYRRRAIWWYERALPELEGLDRIAAAKKLEDLGVVVDLDAPAASSSPDIPAAGSDAADHRSDADLLDAAASDLPSATPPREAAPDKPVQPPTATDVPAKKPTEKPVEPAVEDFFGPRPPRPAEDDDAGDFFGE